MPAAVFQKNIQYYKFCSYGFLKNLRFFEPFLLLFLINKGISFTEIGLLIGIRQIIIILSEIPSGIIADAIGRRRTLASSFVFYIGSFLIFFFADGFYVYIIAMLFFAGGDAVRTGVHKAMIFEYLKLKEWENQKTAYYGHTRSWSQAGTAISSLLAGVFVFFSGEFRYIFLLSVIPYIIDFGLVLSYPKELEGGMKVQASTIRTKLSEVMMAFWISIRSLNMLKAMTNNAVHSGYYTSVKDYLQALLQSLALALPLYFFFDQKQQTAIVVGIGYFFVYMATSMTARSSGKFAKKFNDLSKPLNFTLLAGLVAGIISGIFYQSDFFMIAAFFFVLILLIENIRKPIGIVYVAELTNEKAMASVLSAESQLSSFFAAVFAPCVGFLADQFGLGAGLLIFTIVLVVLMPFYWVNRLKKD